MAYTINKTDGSILTTVPDGQTDKYSSDLSLIGKNYSGFGEILNENFVKLLENFSNTTPPENPLKGEIWFDSGENRLKVYNGVSFATVGSATISALQPTTLNPGDLWFDEAENQLYFYDGTDTILIGPDYGSSQGRSGVKVETITDTLNQTRTITLMYAGGVLIGIFSKEGFTPKSEIVGFSGSIVPGFNLGSLAGGKLNATATNSEKLAGKDASLYLVGDGDCIIKGTLDITDDLGLTIGSTPGNALFRVDSADVVLANTAQDRDIRVLVRKGITPETAINIKSADRTIELFAGLTDSVVQTGGSLIVDGNLTVKGTTTTVNTTNLEVKDKSIELAKTDSPSDATADGGGFILKGTTDHEFLWTDATDAWNSTEHINLAAGRSFKIDGVEVLSGTSLGSGITSAPGITSFGNQSFLNVDDLFFNDNVIEITPVDTDLVLKPQGTGTVNISSKRISELADPVNPQDGATKEYVDNKIEQRHLIFSLDVSGLFDADIKNYLTIVAPPGDEYRNGTEARLICVEYSNDDVNIDISTNITKNTVTVNTLPSGTANVLQDIAVSTITIPGPTLTITRTIKVYRIQAGVWVKISG